MESGDADLNAMSRDDLIAEAKRLRVAVRNHRDQVGDDRCWADDDALYSSLPEGGCPLKAFSPQEKDILMARCSRYWDTRFYPSNAGRNHEWGSVAHQGLYKHFKGGLYLVHGVAKHAETGERLVVYRPLYGSFELMLRPEAMFVEEVDRPDYRYKGPRFQFMSEMF